MSGMEWNAAWETGIPAIDRQHRELLQRANGLLAAILAGAPEPGVEEMLFHLAQYTDYHFRDEERLMADSDCPGRAEHRQAHDLMREKVAGMVEREERAAHPLTSDLIEFFYDWLTNHMGTFDQALAAHLREWTPSSRKGHLELSTD